MAQSEFTKVIFGDLSPIASHIGLVALVAFMIGCSGGGSGAPGGGNTTPKVTSVALDLSAASLATGAPVTLTAAVTSAGTAVSSGSVVFSDGATLLKSTNVSGTGSASYTATLAAVGTHTLTAMYQGNATFAPSTSAPQTLTVTAAPVQTTSVALTVSSGTSTQGLPVKLIATISATVVTGSATPTGTVTLMSGSTTIGTASVDPSGVARYTDTLLPVGANELTASYSGDTNFGASTSNSANVAVNTSGTATYTNPLNLNANSTEKAPSCADPAIYDYLANGVDTWYLYCTSDALYAGDPLTHYINVFKSSDLVNYTYVGDAFTGLPSWADVDGAALWGPAIKYFNGQYYLYYTTPASGLAGGGAAIGVGTSSSPAGPFVDSGAAVVEPELTTNCCAGSYRSTLDPDEIQDASGQRYLLFGSFTGGIYVRKLSSDGLTSDKASEQLIANDSRYEGGNWVYHDGYYYLFASATNCCNGPLSGYGVFAGRALTPLGPYLDAQGISLTAVNVGGTPVLAMNGNSIVGPGGNVVFQDESLQSYILYHGIVAASPYYTGNVGYTARPALLDALDWEDGWPVTRGGFGPSDAAAPQPMPVAQPGGMSSYVTTLATPDTPQTAIAALSDEFNTTTLSPQWTTIHGAPPYTLTGSAYQVQTVGFDTTNAMANVPLLAEAAPAGDYVVETSMSINLPSTGDNANYAQGGLIIYGDDANYLRLDVVANSDTRQIEFIKGQTPVGSGYPNWGATDLGPPALDQNSIAYLRIVKRIVDGHEIYTAYSSTDKTVWIKGGTWTQSLGSGEKICIYAGNLAGYNASFDYLRVSTIN